MTDKYRITSMKLPEGFDSVIPILKQNKIPITKFFNLLYKDFENRDLPTIEELIANKDNYTQEIGNLIVKELQKEQYTESEISMIFTLSGLPQLIQHSDNPHKDR